MKSLSTSFKYLFLTITLCLLPFAFMSSQAQSQVNHRAEWFIDARYGMFIHWGVYSGAEGVWKGEKLRYDNDYAEWIYYRNRIEKDEYLTLLDKFDWSTINPEEWVILAKKAGMKYVTLTAKHHDGFALWDSQVSDYDVAEYTHPKRDIVRELADACKKHGLKMGLYYSHWVDWEHPFGWDHLKEIYPIEPEQYDQYWQEKVIPQMQELLTNYGDIGMIWFDMWIHHSRSIVSKEQLMQLKDLIRELQPDCLVNSRLGLSVEEDPDVDFRTLGDNRFGSRKLDYPWQSPATVAHSWGYHAFENQWKSSTTLLKSLINNVSLNGNLLLNIGPRANGDVPFEIEQRLLQIGEWLKRNGDAIYGAGGFDLDKNQHDWCQITSKEEGGVCKIYLHVPNWPLDHELKLTGIQAKPSKVWLLADSLKSPIEFVHQEVVTTLNLPDQQPDPLVSVIVVEYSEYPDVVNALVAESMSDGYSLTLNNCTEKTGSTDMIPAQRFGSVPPHISVNQKSKYRWRVYIEKPMVMTMDISYSYQGESGEGRIKLTAHDESFLQSLTHTGRFVGEPNVDWQIESFNSHSLGKLAIPAAGYYNFELEIKPPKDQTVDFQWVWLGRN